MGPLKLLTTNKVSKYIVILIQQMLRQYEMLCIIIHYYYSRNIFCRYT